jgi:hypothetical protein
VLLSFSEYPLLHVAYVHVLAAHEMPVAFFTVTLQSVEQLPHLARFAEVDVSQPVLPVAQCENPD